MSACFNLLTSLLIAQSSPPPEALLYTVGRELDRMQAQIQELRSLVAQLERRGACDEARTEKPKAPSPPPPPPVAPRLPPARRERGWSTIQGRVLLDRVRGKTAYVYVASIKEPPVDEIETIAQRGRQFVPAHLVVQSGTTIVFPNEDNEAHHVFSVSPVTRFDLGLAMKTSPVQKQRFVEPGVVDINCNQHAAMNAKVLVVPNRHFVKVAPDGSFSLRAPSGRRTIAAWAPGAQIQEVPVNLRAGATEGLSIRLEPRKRWGAR
jgi:plastocyanin